ncbi:MAG: hypothetical protein K2P32_02420, partial [Clostridia bacterium]|nr:hypothetical protein [Clostridia bacterium]
MADKSSLIKKKAGILLPIFSLPGKYGIGTLGKSAYDFVDFLNFLLYASPSARDISGSRMPC